MTQNTLKIEVQSEIGKLNAVLLHRPGAEVENMTPNNVQRALYSDILNLSVAQTEYEQLYGVLSKVAKVHEVRSLLVNVLDQFKPRADLIRRICETEDVMAYYEELMMMKSPDLARVLIEGLPARINTLTSYLKNEYYALYPLYNFYFTRDAAVTIGNNALICRMANKVRMRESFIMDAIYRTSGVFDCTVVDANLQQSDSSQVIMEGGDIMIDRFRKSIPYGRYNVIVQQLPAEPESFIHLDMVFTMLDTDKCMVFKPLIMQANQYQTVHIVIEDGHVTSIRPVSGLLSVLKKLGMDLKPIVCGGADEWDQEREQWHSGANFFAFAPGKVLSYARNIHTLEELSKNGFEVVQANDFISGKADATVYGDSPCVVTIDGSELPRGGGGARCMTMPLSRNNIV